MTAPSIAVGGHRAQLSGLAVRGMLAALAAVLALLLLFTAAGRQPATRGGAVGVNVSAIPAAYVPWVLAAGSLCTDITPAVIAAQDQAESGWSPSAVSGAGAEGIAQFLPATFMSWGRDDDGTGNVSPFNPRDEIMAQGRFDCSLAALARQLLASGQATGSVVDLALAAYNAGSGRVETAHGVPADAAAYVREIDSLAAGKYAAVGVAGSAVAQVAVAAAESALGTPYQWGGTCTDPHGADPAGWCDCSSLMQMAWAAAGVALPRTTFAQVSAGTPVASVKDLQPGDLVFIPGADGSAAAPGHVGMYVSDGMLIQAPTTGQVVQFTPLASFGPIVAMRHIRLEGGDGL